MTEVENYEVKVPSEYCAWCDRKISWSEFSFNSLHRLDRDDDLICQVSE